MIYSEDVEFAVIGCCMRDNNTVPIVLSFLTEDDFYEPIHKILFHAIKALDGLGRKIDIVTIVDFLRKEEQLEVVGGGANIARFLTGNIESQNIEYYVNLVKEKSLSREIEKKASFIQSNPESPKRNEWINEMLNLEKTVPGKTKEIISLKEALEQDVVLEGYETKFKALDKILDRIHKQEYFAIGARPSHGKTSFALNLAVNFAKQNIPVIFFSLEMSSYFLTNRIIAAESRIPYRNIIYKKLDNGQEKHYQSIKKQIADYPIFFEADPKTSIVEIEKLIREFKNKYNECIPIIDYLQIVKSKTGRTREQEVAEMSGIIKRLTMELDIPILVLSQLSRKLDSRGKEAEPLLSDFRESGAIEQDCDIALFLQRDSKAIHSETNHEEVKFLIQKRRNGATGKAILKFHKNYTKFDNYTEELPFI